MNSMMDSKTRDEIFEGMLRDTDPAAMSKLYEACIEKLTASHCWQEILEAAAIGYEIGGLAGALAAVHANPTNQSNKGGFE